MISRRPTGMTLIEVLIALGVLAVGITGSISSVVFASRFASTASHLQEASALTQSLLSALEAVPYTARGSGASGGVNNLFTNSSATNDNDIADSASVFATATLPVGSYDHADTELAGTPLASMVAPLPIGRTTFERYWNVAPLAAGTGVTLAVIVRWKEGSIWRRTVVVGTRYSP
jgi:type IV pilus modification protein PilV